MAHGYGAAALAMSLAGLAASPAAAADMGERLRQIEDQLMAQAERLAAQEKRLVEQETLIEEQIAEVRALRAQRDSVLAEYRAGRVAPPSASAQPVQLAQVDPLPRGPVGQAPAERPVREVTALPEHMGVLTRPGQLLVEPWVEYGNTSSNRLIFRGAQYFGAVNLGVIEAGDADRDSVVGGIGARLGLTSRLEVEARASYVRRNDRVEDIRQIEQQGAANPVLRELSGEGLGDVEVAARYQLNSGARGWPIFVANARVKPPTGTGPYDVAFDEAGVAQELSTGSGFWGAEAGVTMLYPSDPAVIFGGLSYLSNFGRDINKRAGEIDVLHVEPGDAISASLGFGLALNPRFSFSLGYAHNYIFETSTDLRTVRGPSTQTASGFHVGAMQMGWSFRLTDKLTLSNNFEFGVTSEAPDLRVVFRAPYRF